jgi:hypothetical protein
MSEKIKMAQAQGQLLTAMAGGGEMAVLRIARGRGPAAELAREALELATNPFHNLDLSQAVNIICGKN